MSAVSRAVKRFNALSGTGTVAVDAFAIAAREHGVSRERLDRALRAHVLETAKATIGAFLLSIPTLDFTTLEQEEQKLESTLVKMKTNRVGVDAKLEPLWLQALNAVRAEIARRQFGAKQS